MNNINEESKTSSKISNELDFAKHLIIYGTF